MWANVVSLFHHVCNFVVSSWCLLKYVVIGRVGVREREGERERERERERKKKKERKKERNEHTNKQTNKETNEKTKKKKNKRQDLRILRVSTDFRQAFELHLAIMVYHLLCAFRSGPISAKVQQFIFTPVQNH